MSSLLTCQGVVFATAMAISAGTLILIDLFKEKEPNSQTTTASQDFPRQDLKSCLASGSKKTEKAKKKKKVQFADCVRNSSGTGELYRRSEHRKSTETRRRSDSCANEVLGLEKMPVNHMMLYSGMLRDRVQRTGFSC